MILYEFEGKEMFALYGIKTPKSQVISSPSEEIKITLPFFAKAQVLSGKRKDAGGIVLVEDAASAKSVVKKMFGSTINKERVSKILIEEKADFSKEIYVSISYDTTTRGPVVTYSEVGGTGIEERKATVFSIDILTLTPKFPKVLKIPTIVQEAILRMIKLFVAEDAMLVEINPMVVSGKQVLALDAKVKLDDYASARHKEREFAPRAVAGHKPTKNEIEAKKIDETDYRGTAGSTYFDLPGDIAVLASGGGASLTAMDALVASGGKPANYTEYSGNPPKEKVEKLTQIVLSKDNIHGLWVVGAIANFTNIYETLSGFLEALRSVKPKPKFPIVIRRGGPHDKEAFEMLRKVKDFDLYLYGEEVSITKSAKKIADLAKQYATSK